MKKARKRFVLYAMLSLLVLLVILLGIINIVNFSMAASDADYLTAELAKNQGRFMDFGPPAPDQLPGDFAPPQGDFPGSQQSGNSNGNRVGAAQKQQAQQMPGSFQPFFAFPFGDNGFRNLNSTEMANSLRYFTFAFDQDGQGEKIALRITAVSEADAREWAQSLLKEGKTGWTRGTYRYRVYEANGKTYVTVIDQSRELTVAYRILWISLAGLALGLIISCLVLMHIGKRLFQPLEEADRKQKRFIADAEKEFKIPLTVIDANTEIIERENGETEQTQSIHRQVRRMTTLVKNLATLGVYDEGDQARQAVNLTALAQAVGEAHRAQMEQKGCKLTVSADQPVILQADSESMNDLVTELLNNAMKFASAWAEMSVAEENGHVTITASNDTALPAGTVDQAFDRFVRLENAKDQPGFGLGLSHVKEIVRAHNGRASARVADGVFTLRITL